MRGSLSESANACEAAPSRGCAPPALLLPCRATGTLSGVPSRSPPLQRILPNQTLILKIVCLFLSRRSPASPFLPFRPLTAQECRRRSSPPPSPRTPARSEPPRRENQNSSRKTQRRQSSSGGAPSPSASRSPSQNSYAAVAPLESSLFTHFLCSQNQLKKPHSIAFSKSNQLRPFEDASSLQFWSSKNDASLFLIGSHTKKRPNALIWARCFAGEVMELLEVGVEEVMNMASFKVSLRYPSSYFDSQY